MGSKKQRTDLLNALLPVVKAAGRVVMDVYRTDFVVYGKADCSPVTEADKRAEALIVTALQAITPDVPIVAEEAVASGRIPAVGEAFWLVDPLDGTKEFISRNGEFTINIALIESGQPVLGVVFAPALERLYGGAVGTGAFVEDVSGRHRIECRSPAARELTAVASRSHGNVEALQAFVANNNVVKLINAGSSLKLCLVASGEADIYPRFGRTMEWDIAAGHAVLVAAGGQVIDVEGARLSYGKPHFANPHFVAWGTRGCG